MDLHRNDLGGAVVVGVLEVYGIGGVAALVLRANSGQTYCVSAGEGVKPLLIRKAAPFGKREEKED